ncbi:MAG: hypothetical protein P4L26_04130 [Terracidiphilus sp.]|nr:hypothetical protein [Terracidiphilus sp.]
MFDLFKPKSSTGGDPGITSLDLRITTPSAAQSPPRAATPPAPQPAPTPVQQPVQTCAQLALTLEGAHMYFSGAFLKIQELQKNGAKPELLYYLVYPQQGHTFSVTTSDGSRTILPLFTSKPMADAYIAAKKIGAIAAVCRLENLPALSEKWADAGMNFYAFNICCRCVSLLLHPIAELQLEEPVVNRWRNDAGQRRQFAETFGRGAYSVIGSNPKAARTMFEGMRDHIDPANPYLHWVIAVLAGMAGDMDANAASIKRLEEFGPPFIGKLQGTSFDPTQEGSQMSTMAEAMIGLGASLGMPDFGKMKKNTDAI